jgi:hypothetical protein
MTRKDYVVLAQVLKDAKPGTGPGLSEVEYQAQVSQWQWTASLLAVALQRDNPRFNRDTFNAAAGVA